MRATLASMVFGLGRVGRMISFCLQVSEISMFPFMWTIEPRKRSHNSSHLKRGIGLTQIKNGAVARALLLGLVSKVVLQYRRWVGNEMPNLASSVGGYLCR
jgi:hypothetical protein